MLALGPLVKAQVVVLDELYLELVLLWRVVFVELQVVEHLLGVDVVVDVLELAALGVVAEDGAVVLALAARPPLLFAPHLDLVRRGRLDHALGLALELGDRLHRTDLLLTLRLPPLQLPHLRQRLLVQQQRVLPVQRPGLAPGAAAGEGEQTAGGGVVVGEEVGLDFGEGEGGPIVIHVVLDLCPVAEPPQAEGVDHDQLVEEVPVGGSGTEPEGLADHVVLGEEFEVGEAGYTVVVVLGDDVGVAGEVEFAVGAVDADAGFVDDLVESFVDGLVGGDGELFVEALLGLALIELAHYFYFPA